MTAYLRPQAAAAAYGVSLRTLARWAQAGLIGRAQVEGCSFYVMADIEDLIGRNVAARTVVPIAARQQASTLTESLAYFASPSSAAPSKKRPVKRH